MCILETIKNSFLLYVNCDKAYKSIEKINWVLPFWILIGINLLGSVIAFFSNLFFGFNGGEAITYLFIFLGILIFFPILYFIAYGIYYTVLKLIGGKGNFLDTVKFGASLGIPPTLVGIFFNFISEKSFEGGDFSTLQILVLVLVTILSLALFILIIWSIIISILVYAKLHKISTLRSFFAFVINVFIWVILALIVFLIFLAIGSTFVDF